MLNFTNTFLNSIQYSHDNNEEKRMKGGFPMNEYEDMNQNDDNENNIIYGGDDGFFQMQEKSYVMEGGSFFVPMGLVYFPPPLCDYDHNKNHEFSEDVPVISDKRFDSLFALVSSSQKSNTKSLSSRKLKRLNPFKKTKKNTKK
jgi:hypothetical protein